MMGHAAREVGAGELHFSHDAEGVEEVQETTMKKRKMVIIGENLCKCARWQIGRTRSSGEEEEEITAVLSDCPRLASTERERVKVSEDETQVLQETVNDFVHMTPSETHRSPLMMR